MFCGNKSANGQLTLKFMDAKDQKTEKEEKKSGAEKPISLWGAPFTDVLGALLKTKPMPRENNTKEKVDNGGTKEA